MKKILAVLAFTAVLLCTLPDIKQTAPAEAGAVAESRARETSQTEAVTPTLRQGSIGPFVRWLQAKLNEHAAIVCWWVDSCLGRYRIVVDGVFGRQTLEAVEMFQAQQGLRRDGVVGPKTWKALAHPTAPCDTARKQLVAGGATQREVDLGVRLAKRESGCRLGLHVLRHSSRDDSYGPWMINYYGDRFVPEPRRRSTKLGAPWRNTISWPSAVKMFLKLGREGGWCHWNAPNYCKG